MNNSILVVEDIKSVRQSMVMALSRLYRTYEAANGREAMEVISLHNDIRVVISDYQMPEVDGFELLDKIRNRNTNVDVIFVTGVNSIEAAVLAMKNGAFDYMTKPVDLEKLESTIHNAMNHCGSDSNKQVKGGLS